MLIVRLTVAKHVNYYQCTVFPFLCAKTVDQTTDHPLVFANYCVVPGCYLLVRNACIHPEVSSLEFSDTI